MALAKSPLTLAARFKDNKANRISAQLKGETVNFDAKKVLVTGGSRGIGLAISTAFAAAGASVAIVYRANDSAAAALQILKRCAW